METREFPGGSHIAAEVVESWGDHNRVGTNVVVEAKRLRLGRNVWIGAEEDEDAFRRPGGVRIRVDTLILGDNVRIGRQVLMRGGHIELRRDSRIGHDCTVKVNKSLVVGEHGIINDQCEIAGVNIEIGRELWMLSNAKIGGGSAFEVHSSLRAGHWLHLGTRTLVNTARPVVLGDEVGLGTGTSLYTHGAYPSALEGKPVAFGPITIGDRSWLPGAVVNPSVTIGADCVIGVGSVVTKDVPTGSLAAGVPAKVLKENAYPRPLTDDARLGFVRDFFKAFGEICSDREPVEFDLESQHPRLRVGTATLIYALDAGAAGGALSGHPGHAIVLAGGGTLGGVKALPVWTLIDLAGKCVSGTASPLTERLLNQLRRYGIRFNFEAADGRYRAWA